MLRILRWMNYPFLKKKFSLYFYFYKIIFTITKKKYPKIIDLVHFDSDKQTKLKYIETKIGKFLVFSHDGGISRQLFINKQYNFKSFQKVIRIIGKQDLLIDIGANIIKPSGFIKHNYDIEEEKLLRVGAEVQNLISHLEMKDEGKEE